MAPRSSFIVYLKCTILCDMLVFVNMLEKECPDFVEPALFYYSHKFPAGYHNRAFDTVPGEFDIRTSSIPDAGLGIFSKTFIKKYTWLGEYEGEFTPLNFTSGFRSKYSWLVHDNGVGTHYVDASDLRLCNWLRFMNCARHVTEQNVAHSLCYGRVYYRTTRDVLPGSELLTYYGRSYAAQLGIDIYNYDKL